MQGTAQAISSQLRGIIFVLSVLVGISTLVVIGMSFGGGVGSASPFLIGFEIVTLVSAAFGVMLARGRFNEGAALALLCIAGAIGVGALLGYVGAGKVLMGRSLTPYLVGRGAAAAVFALIAACIVLGKKPDQTIPSLIRGVVFGVGFVLVVGATYALRGQLFAMPAIIVTFGLILIAVLALGLLAAGVHYCIRAFEMGLFTDSTKRTARP